MTDFFLVTELLLRIQSGFFFFDFLVPPASTWSRLRNSTSPGQPPLRSRSQPLGTSSLDLRATRQVRQANKELESMLLCAEYALECKTAKVGLHLIFPEDLGVHRVDGPTSIWALRESQLLEGVNDAHRYAGYLCRFACAEHKRPIAVLSSGRYSSDDFYRGWSNLSLHNNILSYRGPYPCRVVATGILFSKGPMIKEFSCPLSTVHVVSVSGKLCYKHRGPRRRSCPLGLAEMLRSPLQTRCCLILYLLVAIPGDPVSTRGSMAHSPVLLWQSFVRLPAFRCLRLGGFFRAALLLALLHRVPLQALFRFRRFPPLRLALWFPRSGALAH